jgi:hypothetical protein
VSESDLAKVQRDLVAWDVLEPEPPIRFTRRFKGALTRAAAQLQAAEQSGQAVTGHPLQNQVEVALAGFLEGKEGEAGREHRQFVVAVHLESLPAAVRRLLGL